MNTVREQLHRYRNDLLLLLLLFTAALAVKFYFLPFYTVISADGIGYATIARSLFQPGGLASASHFPPFYPFLIALMNLLTRDVELAGRLVSMVMGSLLVVPLYLLGSQFFSRRAGLAACLIAITWPSLRFWSGEVMSQATYITMTCSGLSMLWLAAARRSAGIGAAAGIFMGLAYLTRPEALIILVAATPAVIALMRCNGASWRKALLPALAGWCAFTALAFPYILLLHETTGKWQLTAKTGATLWVGLGQYLGKFDVYREPGFKPLGFMDIIRSYPDFIPYNVNNNLKAIATEMLPPYFWGVALLGCMTGGWGRAQIFARLFLASTFAPLALIVVFFLAGPEYTQLSLPVLLLWIGQGLTAVETKLSELGLLSRLAWLKALLQRNLVTITCMLGLSLLSFYQQIPPDRNKTYTCEQDGGRYDHKRMGLLLKQHLPPGAVIMTRAGRIGYYSDHPNIDIPQVGAAAILAYGRSKNARFLIVDGMLQMQRPQLWQLFTPLNDSPDRGLFLPRGNEFTTPDGLRLYLLYKDPSSMGMAVYEFMS